MQFAGKQRVRFFVLRKIGLSSQVAIAGSWFFRLFVSVLSDGKWPPHEGCAGAVRIDRYSPPSNPDEP